MNLQREILSSFERCTLEKLVACQSWIKITLDTRRGLPIRGGESQSCQPNIYQVDERELVPSSTSRVPRVKIASTEKLRNVPCTSRVRHSIIRDLAQEASVVGRKYFPANNPRLTGVTLFALVAKCHEKRDFVFSFCT